MSTWMSFWEKLVGAKATDDVASVAGVFEPYVSPFAQTPEDIAAGRAAEKAWADRCIASVIELTRDTKEAAYKIRQAPEGHWLILKRQTESAYFGGFNYSGSDGVYPAAEYDGRASQAYINYVPVENMSAPTYRNSMSYYGQHFSSVPKITGYKPMKFNAHADAEAYLFRMVEPEKHETAYDFPPLKKRTKPRVKKPTDAALAKAFTDGAMR